MTYSVRLATSDDLSAIAEITRRAREQRAAWEPDYFRVADGADETHRRWLAELVDSGDAMARVVVDGDQVVGCAFAVRHGGRWVVEDVAPADDGWWADGMVELLRTVKERPALTCVPRKDVRATGCCATVGLRLRSSYWRRTLTDGQDQPPADVTETASPDALRAAPWHTFDPVDPSADGVTVLGDGSGGHAVLAAPAAAPPVYDPGGTTGLLERVTGGRRGDLVDAAAVRSAARGDVQLVVVCADDDPVLEDVLVDRGFSRVADVYSWPSSSGG